MYLTGHSLGGGIVTQLLPELVAYFPGADVQAATFGAPPVMGSRTSRRWNIQYGRYLWRVENSLDFVTRIPKLVGLHAVGQLVYINRKGWIFSRVSGWFRYWDRLRRRRIGDGDLSDFEDHKLLNYIHLIKNAIRRVSPKPL